jgi:ribosomal protein L24E
MFNIKIAAHGFKCHFCGLQVSKGTAYIEGEDGTKYCFCQLPKRRLKPLNRNEHVNIESYKC